MILEISGPADQIDALVDERIAEAGARLAARNESQSNGSELTPFKFEQLEGTCGWSWVELRSSGSERQGQAYVRAGFQLAGVSSASTYATDVLVYSNAALDLWTGHLKDSGALSGTLKWQKDTRFTVPKTQEYGAHFYVGTVAVVKDGRPASCYTKGPRVDNVKIYVSN